MNGESDTTIEIIRIWVIIKDDIYLRIVVIIKIVRENWK